MFRVSEVAAGKMRETLAGKGAQFIGIRVAVEAGGCSGFQYAMNLEKESREGDEVLQLDGLQVFVDEQSMLYLEGTEIDYESSFTGEGFRFKNPNTTGTCGCGESFSA